MFVINKSTVVLSSNLIMPATTCSLLVFYSAHNVTKLQLKKYKRCNYLSITVYTVYLILTLYAILSIKYSQKSYKDEQIKTNKFITSISSTERPSVCGIVQQYAGQLTQKS